MAINKYNKQISAPLAVPKIPIDIVGCSKPFKYNIKEPLLECKDEVEYISNNKNQIEKFNSRRGSAPIVSSEVQIVQIVQNHSDSLENEYDKKLFYLIQKYNE